MDSRVQRWIWEKRWTELRDIQEEAIAAVLDTNDDILLAAATASGKTEAVFLPLCSQLAGQQATGIRLVYVSPLKALINDQFGRLSTLCEDLDLPVHRWHGDVGDGARQALLRSPAGILLITPESLEAFFVLRGSRLRALFGGLEAVVLDEVHSFIGRERGRQLQSLLHRLEAVAKQRVRRIGLSATLGDMMLAAEFLRPKLGGSVRQIVSAAAGQEIQLQIRGYLDNNSESAGRSGEGEPQGAGDARDAISAHLFETLHTSDNLIFANSRQEVEDYTDRLRRLANSRRLPESFWPHHGSLAKSIREEVEERLKASEGAINVVCTSTLELGIDIGSVTSIAQLGPPPSVSSLRQRLGRSGRRGDPAVLRIYADERRIRPDTPPQDQLRAGLFQSIAMVDLLLERWCEPPESENLHLSTLVQQVLSVLAQHGGARADELWQLLCRTGPFAQIDAALFQALLRQLGAEEILMQDSSGALLPGGVGERILNHHGFYAAFATPEEYRVLAAGRELGTLPVDFALTEGMYLIFAGRRWRVRSVDDVQRVIEVDAAAAGRAPRFSSAGGAVHDRVRERMREIYLRQGVPGYCDSGARALIAEGRANFARHRLTESALVVWGNDVIVFPWAGDRVLATLALSLSSQDLSVMPDGVALTVVGGDAERVADALRDIGERPPDDPVALARRAPGKMREKYDYLLGDDLLAFAYASRQLDPMGAKYAAAAMQVP